METLVINIPDKKSALVKQLLKELGVTINSNSAKVADNNAMPNKTTAKTIADARNGKGLNARIKDIHGFVNSI
jgi:ribosomal protein S6